ncbi:MAG TPA: hypothetical protein VG674_23185 [Amycolatopsis sp.]|nr:hypothetical protein [Amycolatopsis sp.]
MPLFPRSTAPARNWATRRMPDSPAAIAVLDASVLVDLLAGTSHAARRRPACAARCCTPLRTWTPKSFQHWAAYRARVS